MRFLDCWACGPDLCDSCRLKTLDQFLAKERPRIEADPTTGAPLDDGVSQDDAGVNWKQVPMSRREWVLRGMDIGALDRHPGPTLRRQWARELSQTEVSEDWRPIKESVLTLKASEAEALRERLYIQRQPAPFVKAAEPEYPGEAAAKGGVYIGGQSRPMHERVYIVVDPADAAAAAALRKHILRRRQRRWTTSKRLG